MTPVEQNLFRVQTRRLELIRATLELALTEAEDSSRLAGLLDVRMPQHWPPPLNDADSMQWFINFLRDPLNAAWGFYYFVWTESGRALVGNGGYKGKPTPEGMVEVGYSICPEYQRRGFASEATRALIAHAFASPQVTRVDAETLPELEPSIGVMLKCGMRFLGPGSEPGTIRYGITREEWGA